MSAKGGRTAFQIETSGSNSDTRPVHWKRITLVGVGLLGGSLGLALRKRRLADKVAGYVRRAASLTECKRLGAVDEVTRDLCQAVSGADLVVLCTPIAQMRTLVEQMSPALKPGAIVTDVGSVKGSVVRDLESMIARAGGHFIGSHPMAGSEKTGVGASRADLFEEAVCVITPTPKSSRAAVRKVDELWQAVGARTMRMTPAAHDALVGRSSHLPHVMAAALANFVLSPSHPKAQALLCATGFRDTTRIASGSPEMWRDIALANRANLGKALASLVRELSSFRRVLQNGDQGQVAEFFNRAKQRRDAWSRTARLESPE